MRGCEKVGRYNLLEEPWITVLLNQKGETKQVSMIELFENAHQFDDFAGDTKAQDFAVMRVMLAVLHTVFSRFDAEGKEYGYVSLDERFRPTNRIDEDDEKEYSRDLFETWKNLWDAKKFPGIVREYLEKWHDRFYLFDEEYPFFQVTVSDQSPDKMSKKSPSVVSGKNMNRLISESGNKLALFSPKYDANSNKEKLSEDEIVRWLITFQNYTGLSDKAIYGQNKYKSSKGWLFDLGGIYLQGKNLYETLVLNTPLVHPEPAYHLNSQNPAWENTSTEIIEALFKNPQVGNLAELYTRGSRAIYIDPEFNVDKPFSFSIVKLPDIPHENQFLELMTTWRYNESGENKETFTPRKHRVNQSLWRSFGLLTVSYQGLNVKGKSQAQRKPGIIDWLIMIERIVKDRRFALQAISMQDDGNATSWVPVDVIFDTLQLNEVLLTDIQDAGWVPRINEAVEKTKKVAGSIYKRFMQDIKEIRNLSSDLFVTQQVEELYFIIDAPFRQWISHIQAEDSKDEKIKEWYNQLYRIILNHANEKIQQAGPRDYTGIVEKERTKNIATAFSRFQYNLNQEIKVKEGY